MKMIVCFLLTMSLFASDLDKLFHENEEHLIRDSQPQFISLGGDCHIALPLRDRGFRQAAFPFDWVVSENHEGFIKALNEDFLFFTNKECFKVHDDGISCNDYYNIRFVHDFEGDEWMDDIKSEQWNVFKTKYDRRIDRFRQLREYRGRVFFVRTFWTTLKEGEFNQNTKWAKELKDALDHYFPFLDFTLIIVSYEDLNIPPMKEISGVVEFRTGRSLQAFNLFYNTDIHFRQPTRIP